MICIIYKLKITPQEFTKNIECTVNFCKPIADSYHIYYIYVNFFNFFKFSNQKVNTIN